MADHHIMAVVGMHRSGTSLTARYLGESGLFMGYDLIGKHWSNPSGHFEDRDFIKLHHDLLKAHHVDFKLSAPVNWNITDDFVARAKAIINERKSFAQWGWKDPRTTLFLPFWKETIPGCHFVVVYRNYLPVVNSLISRDILHYRATTGRLQRFLHPRYTRDYIIRLTEVYLKAWIWYNTEIISHIFNDPAVKYKLVGYDQLSGNDFSKLDELQQFGFKLDPPAHFNRNPKRARAVKNIPFTTNVSLVQEAEAVDRYFTAMLKG